MKKLLFIVFLISGSSWTILHSQTINHWETAVFNTDTWRYWIGISEPGQNWWSLSFDDSTWPEDPGGFGYGDDDDNTIIPQCSSVYLRIKFNITDTSLIRSAILSMDYDDGFIAYLNDIEIARAGVEGIHPPFDQLAVEHEAEMYRGVPIESFLISKKKLKTILANGENILAIQVHNDSQTSGDLSSNAWFSFGITDTSHLFRQVPDWFTPIFEFISSNLPIVVINTSGGEDIMDEPKITADMKIIHNGSGKINHVSDNGNIYSGKVGIEIRGRYSASLPQKPYNFETRDNVGNNLNVSILGMPEENDWVLTANYNDKSFLRNYLAFDIFTRMGHYATRIVYCEVVLNGQYQGIYLLGEKIKQDKNRVNISKLTSVDNSGDDLTGGYIFANDYYETYNSWLSNFSPLNSPGSEVYFVYYDPKYDELNVTQKEYIKDYVDSFESTLYSADFKDPSIGYRAYLDVNSFVDYFLVGEISRNVDAYKKSRFYYKDKDSKSNLIHSGPVWDFDWAWKDITENCWPFNQPDGSGWAYKVNECNPRPTAPSWEVRLLEDSDFANRIYKRYFQLRRTILSQITIDRKIDSVATLLNDAQERHFEKWQTLGRHLGTEEIGEPATTFSGEIEKFKSWINRRLTWLDANMVGENSSGDDDQTIIRVFPNPAADNLHVESDKTIDRITIFSLLGNPVLEKTDCGDYTTLVNVSQLKPGLFIVKVYFNSGEVISQRFVKK